MDTIKDKKATLNDSQLNSFNEEEADNLTLSINSTMLNQNDEIRELKFKYQRLIQEYDSDCPDSKISNIDYNIKSIYNSESYSSTLQNVEKMLDFIRADKKPSVNSGAPTQMEEILSLDVMQVDRKVPFATRYEQIESKGNILKWFKDNFNKYQSSFKNKGYTTISAVLSKNDFQEVSKMPAFYPEDSILFIITLHSILNINHSDESNKDKYIAAERDELIAFYTKILINAVEDQSSDITDSEKGEMSEIGKEEYYESGCILQYHFYTVRHIDSEDQISEIILRAKEMISKYGKKLIPAPEYSLYRSTPTLEEILNDEKLMKTLENENEERALLIKALKETTKKDGVTLLLSKEEVPQEFDSFDFLARSRMQDKLIKVQFTSKSEKDFKEMSEDENLAKEIYDLGRQALIDSNWYFDLKKEQIKVLAVECNSPLIILMLVMGGELSLERNEIKEILLKSVFPVRYLRVYEDMFIKDVNEWNGSETNDQRTTYYTYYPPKGRCTGHRLNVQKYGSDKWLQREYNYTSSEWRTVYHGVSEDAIKKLHSILGGKFKSGKSQTCSAQEDVAEFRNDYKPGQFVGDGVYFAQNTKICREEYSDPVVVEYEQYIVMLQCKVNPEKVKIPKSNRNFEIIDNPDDIRPYRVLIERLGVDEDMHFQNFSGSSMDSELSSTFIKANYDVVN